MNNINTLIYAFGLIVTHTHSLPGVSSLSVHPERVNTISSFSTICARVSSLILIHPNSEGISHMKTHFTVWLTHALNSGHCVNSTSFKAANRVALKRQRLSLWQEVSL